MSDVQHLTVAGSQCDEAMIPHLLQKVIKSFLLFHLKTQGKKKAVEVFTNWPIFRLLEVVPYMPEVKYVLNICGIRDSENCRIAIKLF